MFNEDLIAMIDTGSSVNLITKKLISDNYELSNMKPVDNRFQLLDAQSNPITVHGKITLEPIFEGTEIETEFMVVDSVPTDLLLGTPFLTENEASIHYAKRQISLLDGRVTVLLVEHEPACSTVTHDITLVRPNPEAKIIAKLIEDKINIVVNTYLFLDTT